MGAKEDGVSVWEAIGWWFACTETQQMRGREAALGDQEARVPREVAATGGCFLMSHVLRLTANFPPLKKNLTKRENAL